MKITALAPWFGSKRTMAADIVSLLGKHSCYWGLCCGSFAVELAKPPCSNETAVDLHGDLTNLAWVIQEEATACELYRRLNRTMASETIFKRCQKLILGSQWDGDDACVDRAYAYFVNSWLGRSGMAGTCRENSQIAVRWTKNGGSPAKRFHSAAESIPAWHERLKSFLILRRDIFTVAEKIEDDSKTAIYCDPPYILTTRSGDRGGGKYKHEFNLQDHERLTTALSRFQKSRVVVSYYDSPELDRLYPVEAWARHDFTRTKSLSTQGRRGSKAQQAPEVVLVNRLAGQTKEMFQ